MNFQMLQINTFGLILTQLYTETTGVLKYKLVSVLSTEKELLTLVGKWKLNCDKSSDVTSFCES